MNVWVLPDGTRDRRMRPYIDQEELARTSYPYNPNDPNVVHGLYGSAPKLCSSFRNEMNKTVDKGVRPSMTMCPNGVVFRGTPVDGRGCRCNSTLSTRKRC